MTGQSAAACKGGLCDGWFAAAPRVLPTNATRSREFSCSQTKPYQPFSSITTTPQIPNIQAQLKMADQSGSANTSVADKGKGKGAAEPQNDSTMEVDDSSSDEDVEVAEVSF